MRLIDRYFGKAVWILTGACFAVACSMMLISGSFNPDRFYDVGDVYDGYRAAYMLNGNYGIDYSAGDEILTVASESAAKHITASEGKWRYIYISLSEVNRDNFGADLVCFNDKSELVYHQVGVTFSEGINLIGIPRKIKYNRFAILIENQAGLSFRIDKIQLRKRNTFFSRKQFAKYFMASFFGFVFFTGILFLCIRKRIRKIPWYMPVHRLQAVFLRIGGYGEKLAGRFSCRMRGLIRSGLFCFIFLFSHHSFNLNLYYKEQTYPLLVFVCLLVLVLIAFFCWEKNPDYLNWKNKFTACWMGLWVVAIISNFIVKKKFGYAGFGMILVVGFLFFMWGNMKDRERLLKDFIRGIAWSFFPNLLFCYLFRPYRPEYRYIGASYSPGIFGLYLLFVWLAFLAELDFRIHDKKVLGKDLLVIVMLGICGDLLWKTQSASSILPAGLAALVVSFKLWRNRKQVKIAGVLLYLFIFGISFAADSYCIYHIPRTVNAEIKFEKDMYKDAVTEHPFTVTVSAAEDLNRKRLFNKFRTSTSLETLTTGRTIFWKAYLRKLNLWGHKGFATFNGGGHLAHNGFLAIMYRYGIFAAVPYVLMVLYNFWYACRYFKRHAFGRKYAFFVLINAVCCTLLLFVENLELSFGWVCWYGMYIVMGIYFDDECIVKPDRGKIL